MLFFEPILKVQQLFGDPKTKLEEWFHVDEEWFFELARRKIKLGSLWFTNHGISHRGNSSKAILAILAVIVTAQHLNRRKLAKNCSLAANRFRQKCWQLHYQRNNLLESLHNYWTDWACSASPFFPILPGVCEKQKQFKYYLNQSEHFDRQARITGESNDWRVFWTKKFVCFQSKVLNIKNLIGVWHFANVTKHTTKYLHKVLAVIVDNNQASLACVVRSSVTDGTFIDKDAALVDITIGFERTWINNKIWLTCHGKDSFEWHDRTVEIVNQIEMCKINNHHCSFNKSLNKQNNWPVTGR